MPDTTKEPTKAKKRGRKVRPANTNPFSSIEKDVATQIKSFGIKPDDELVDAITSHFYNEVVASLGDKAGFAKLCESAITSKIETENKEFMRAQKERQESFLSKLKAPSVSATV